jgi:hypothetical protein
MGYPFLAEIQAGEGSMNRTPYITNILAGMLYEHFPDNQE